MVIFNHRYLDSGCINKLKLNQSKTEILHITSQFKNSGDLPSLDVAGVDVISSKNVRA